MKRVLVATPAYDGKVVIWYARSLAHASVIGVDHGVKFEPIFTCYDSLIQRARNTLMHYALDNDYDGLLWIDADMEWEADWAVSVVNSGKDVIGLPYVLKLKDEERYALGCDIEKAIPDEAGHVEVEWAGTGFLYMSKAALKSLWDNATNYVDYNDKNEPIKWLITSTLIKNGGIVGEDIDMCGRLREAGFKIYVDPTKTCGHIGPMTYTGDFAKYIQKKQQEKQEKQE